MTMEAQLGHLLVVCGPPGSGKTTLLKMVSNSGLSVRQVPRLTTRAPRPEEGDIGPRSLEYEFVSPAEFAGRVARGATVNLVEWDGNFYATDLDDVQRTLAVEPLALLLEDMPTAVHLKRTLGAQVTVVMLFTDDVNELLRLEFATVESSERECVKEWRRRLSLKYDAALKSKSPDDRSLPTWPEYLSRKLRRAVPDLAFMAGKIRHGEDIKVLANRRDQQAAMFAAFEGAINLLSRVSRSTLTGAPVEIGKPKRSSQEPLNASGAAVSVTDRQVGEVVRASDQGPTYSLFLSYNKADVGWATWIAWVLEDLGHRVIFQEWDFQVGTNLVQKMHQALKTADKLVLVLSDDYLASGFAASEWSALFRVDPNGSQRRLLPLRVRPCAPEGLLGSVVYLDLVARSEPEAYELLRLSLQSRLKPSVPPLFPSINPDASEATQSAKVAFPGSALAP
jgi:guanylate kinase